MRENSIVAIDFGTSRTKLAYFDPHTEKVELMLHLGTQKYLPSYFAVDKNEEILLGYDAQILFESKDRADKRRAKSNLKGEIFESGIQFNVPTASPPFRKKVSKSPEALLTALFTHLKEEAGKLPAFETGPQRSYLTHPTTFSSDDRTKLEASAQAAGFSVKLIEEPMAASQFFESVETDLSNDIIILDCGAGTLHWTYMHRQFIYGGRQRYVRENGKTGKLTAGGTSGVGGRKIDVALANALQSRLGNRMKAGARMTEDDSEFLCHEAKLRKEEFCRKPDSKLQPIKIDEDLSAELNAREIASAIQRHYITPACNKVEPYIKDVIKETGREPALVLIGGCTQIEGFAGALEEKFGLECITIYDFEYATVLGAVPLSEEVRSQLSNRMQTPQPQSPEDQEVATAIKETFERFGNEMGPTIAEVVMSCLIELVDKSSSKWKSLDIGGHDDGYLVDMDMGCIYPDNIGVSVNIMLYFVKNLPDSVFREFDEKVSTDFSKLTIKAPPGAIPLLTQVQDTFRRDIKQVVKDLLHGILGEIDTEKIIRSVVRFRATARVLSFSQIVGVILDASEKERVLSRKARVKSKIGFKLEGHLKKANIGDAVVAVFRSTAEKLCQRLNQDG